jgi:2-polyprenyl-6-methoxyphenol hydroxylase-like FAD-dependent oxidoreductase
MTVLIVGAGPVGLAVALELAHQGVPSTVLERAPGIDTELLAKAGTLSARSMELCRRWGIAAQVAGWGADADFPRDTCYVTALNGGHLIGRDVVAPARTRVDAASPEMLRKCPQHIFDPLLARALADTGLADVRYGAELRDLAQDGDGVTATLADGETVRASYAVGCDGAASRVRTLLGIPFEGPTLDYSVSALVRIKDLDAYHPIGRATRYVVMDTGGTWANLTSVDYGDLWRLTLLGSEQTLAGLDPDAALQAVLGRDDVPYELMRALPWRRSQCTAGRFRQGRVLLAGDAAHTTSPTGGHGLNTGLADALGAGWALAAVVRGWGGDALLDAYEAERRPVAIRNGLSSTRNYEVWRGGGLDLRQVLDDGPAADAARAALGAEMSRKLRAEWHADGIRMGYRYEQSPVIVPDGTPEPVDDPVTYVPTARPGHRAPHAWLAPGRSVLDLFGPGFTLLRFGPADPGALVGAAADRGVPLTVHTIEDPAIAALYERELVLVRPDGHVAWRGDSASASAGVLDIVRGAKVSDVM